jgi:hypothetical protein
VIGRVLFAGAVAAAVGYGYPLVNEHATSACQAVENRYVAETAPVSPFREPGHLLEWAVVRTYLEPLSGGRLAAAAAKQRYPAVPSQMGCAVDYWRELLAVPSRDLGPTRD